MTDPIEAVVTFLRTFSDIPYVTGDMSSREVGQVTVYVEPNGGFRMLRDSEDRMDIVYEAYSLDREEAFTLALRVRDYFLGNLPDSTSAGCYILDVGDVDTPRYDPDPQSREHCYSGEIWMCYVAA